MTCDVTACNRPATATINSGADLCIGHLAELRELHRVEAEGADPEVHAALDGFYKDLPVDRPDTPAPPHESTEGDGGPGYRTHHPDSASLPHPEADK